MVSCWGRAVRLVRAVSVLQMPRGARTVQNARVFMTFAIVARSDWDRSVMSQRRSIARSGPALVSMLVLLTACGGNS